MILRPVNRNALQKRITENAKENFRPNRDTEQQVSAVLLRIYDQQSSLDSLPQEVRDVLTSNPHLVYGMIRTYTGKDFLLPFKETAEHIYAIYGNAKNLEAWKVRILFRNNNIKTGQIVPVSNGQPSLLDPEGASSVGDIGGIIGI